ncbi:MAG: hypothetical protein KJ907_13750 [Actinobacteria bacterium]|nr:hypothetical protein [Actinomycetota bacterium]MBU4403782.1 hypothetical protein [Actinomycetota bacterium]MCG2819292.1 hypothetical protein [Actinomycetes bacterium]
MVGGTEFEALQKVHEAGGEVGAQSVARKMRVDPNYARLVLNSLARADYIDLLASGKYRITAKGKQELKDKGITETEE